MEHARLNARGSAQKVAADAASAIIAELEVARPTTSEPPDVERGAEAIPGAAPLKLRQDPAARVRRLANDPVSIFSSSAVMGNRRWSGQPFVQSGLEPVVAATFSRESPQSGGP